MAPYVPEVPGLIIARGCCELLEAQLAPAGALQTWLRKA